MKFFKNRRNIIVLFICLIAIVLASFFLREFISNYIVRLNMDTTEAPGKGEKVLIFSPHNDDEVLGAGEFIKHTLKNGGEVKVVLMTNGDGFKEALQFDYFTLNPKPNDYINFGYTRQKESIYALKKLGLSEKNIVFLGYPDGGLSALWGAYWDKTTPYTSQNTQSDKSPYTNSFTKENTYCGENVANDISKIIQDYKPTVIVYPHPNDRHPDHWSTNAFVKYALTYLNYNAKKEWLYLVHRGDWPTPMKKETKMYLVPPSKLIGTDTKWYAFNLNNHDINEKTQAIQMYKTQIKTLGPLLAGFERKNELLGIYNNFKMPVSNINSVEIETNDSNKVIKDPLNDKLHLAISKSADISGVYIEKSTNNTLTIALEVNDEIDKNISYDLNLIFFNKRNVSKLNLEVKNNKIYSKKVSNVSIMNTEGIKLNIKGNIILFNISKKITGNFNNMFINSSTSIDSRLMDKTAWRMIDN